MNDVTDIVIFVLLALLVAAWLGAAIVTIGFAFGDVRVKGLRFRPGKTWYLDEARWRCYRRAYWMGIFAPFTLPFLYLRSKYRRRPLRWRWPNRGNWMRAHHPD